MSPQEQAAARSASYLLLARLLREPVSAEIDPYLDAIPQLNPVYLCPDDANAAFQQLFGFALFPHESVFRDSSGLVGGAVADEVARHYRACGFHWRDDTDHVSTELRLLGFLSEAETDALADDLPIVAARMRQLQRDFLQAHLLQWLPPLIVALKRHGDDFYQAVAALVWEMVVDHAQQLNASPTEIAQPFVPDLASADTALKTIGRYLTSPHESGWWLSAGEMGNIGRKLDLPRGFGGRIQTMMNLFRSATQYDGARALLAALQAEAESWQTAYDELGHFTTSWQNKLNTTIALLQEMQTEVT